MISHDYPYENWKKHIQPHHIPSFSHIKPILNIVKPQKIASPIDPIGPIPSPLKLPSRPAPPGHPPPGGIATAVSPRRTAPSGCRPAPCGRRPGSPRRPPGGMCKCVCIYLNLHSDINVCLFNIICLKGVSDRKSDCGRNSVSTIENIEMLYFWGK